MRIIPRPVSSVISLTTDFLFLSNTEKKTIETLNRYLNGKETIEPSLRKFSKNTTKFFIARSALLTISIPAIVTAGLFFPPASLPMAAIVGGGITLLAGGEVLFLGKLIKDKVWIYKLRQEMNSPNNSAPASPTAPFPTTPFIVKADSNQENQRKTAPSAVFTYPNGTVDVESPDVFENDSIPNSNIPAAPFSNPTLDPEIPEQKKQGIPLASEVFTDSNGKVDIESPDVVDIVPLNDIDENISSENRPSSPTPLSVDDHQENTPRLTSEFSTENNDDIDLTKSENSESADHLSSISDTSSEDSKIFPETPITLPADSFQSQSMPTTPKASALPISHTRTLSLPPPIATKNTSKATSKTSIPELVPCKPWGEVEDKAASSCYQTASNLICTRLENGELKAKTLGPKLFVKLLRSYDSVQLQKVATAALSGTNTLDQLLFIFRNPETSLHLRTILYCEIQYARNRLKKEFYDGYKGMTIYPDSDFQDKINELIKLNPNAAFLKTPNNVTKENFLNNLFPDNPYITSPTKSVPPTPKSKAKK